jgi:alkylation response protein AidB-like acyl-CoA dehydrogenase
MHFLPSEEQVELQRGVREVLASAFPLDRLPAGVTPQLWRTLTETGVFSLRTELGLGMVESVLVFEELGRACVPGPLVGTMLAAGLTAAQDAGAVSVLETDSRPHLIAHLQTAAAVLVLDGADATIVDTGALAGDLVPDPVDPLTPLTEVRSVPAGRSCGDAEPLRRDGAVLTAAIQVGLAVRMTELAVDYAKQREQFGHRIGSFQAVKHLCADMFVRTELARVAVQAAAVVLDGAGDGDPARAVAGAKLLADEAAAANARSCVQVHGGMGFTWEVPVHFFVKRAWLHATEFGTADDHAEVVADRLLAT